MKTHVSMGCVRLVKYSADYLILHSGNTRGVLFVSIEIVYLISKDIVGYEFYISYFDFLYLYCKNYFTVFSLYLENKHCNIFFNKCSPIPWIHWVFGCFILSAFCRVRCHCLILQVCKLLSYECRLVLCRVEQSSYFKSFKQYRCIVVCIML